MAKNAVGYKVVVIGGSAGSLEVILQLLPDLRVKNIVVIIVVHRRSDADSLLAELLARKTDVPVKEVEDKEPIHAGTVYLAPPDYHLLLEDQQQFSLDSTEKIHHSRPSIDVLFQSVAEVYGSSAIGVLLSGANADGARGIQKIREAGGYTIVQDPASADIGFMPQQAIDLGAANEVVAPGHIARRINRLLKSSHAPG